MTADERRLLRLFRNLSESRRAGLLDYAEYLLGKAQPDMPEPARTPLDIPRPEQESVIKAIKRLRATYPMIDRARLLNETSALMNQHLIHGRPASEIIDELEILFQRHFQAHVEPPSGIEQ
jgi:hypothetical protein